MRRNSILGMVMCFCLFATTKAWAQSWWEDFSYEESGGQITINGYAGPGGDVVIPDTINSLPVVGIGDWAFYDYSSVTGMIIPDSVTSIGEFAFSGCSGLTRVTIGSSVTGIGYAAFRDCTGLTSVTIPDSVIIIGDYAFDGCTGLTEATLGNGVSSIGHEAFEGCSNLSNVIIGSSVADIGYGAFANCGLTSVTIPGSVTSIGGAAFAFCNGLTSVTIPGSLTSIAPEMFIGCGGLTRVGIGNGITSIGSQAFAFCSGLTSVVIPASVTSIEEVAFYGCSSLNVAYFLGNAPSMGNEVFEYCDPDFKICYTDGTTGFMSQTWYCYPADVCSPPQPACMDDNDCHEGYACVDGECQETTLVQLDCFTPMPRSNKVILTWTTASEIDNAGFNVYRADSKNGPFAQINAALIPAQGMATMGATYEFIDTDVQNRKTYWYKLEDVDYNGTTVLHRPVKATPRLLYGLGK